MWLFQGALDRLRPLILNRDFALFTTGALFSASGLWIQTVAVGWLVLELGNSAFLLGLAGFARLFPVLLLSFPAGVVADRFDRRRLLLTAQCGALLITTGLATTAWLDVISIPLILILALLAGVFDAIAWPAFPVFIKDLVGASQLRLAMAISSARFNLTRIFGPAAGGFLLAAFGAPVALSVAAACILGIIAALVLIRTTGQPAAESTVPWSSALRVGVRYAYGMPRVRRLLLITAGIGLFVFPILQLLPAVARDQLGTGPEGLGFLTSAVGFGAIAGALMSSTRWMQRRTRLFNVALPVGAGLALVALGQANALLLALAALALTGFCMIGYMTMANSTLPVMARDEVVGRVVGLMTVVQGGAVPLGALALGHGADVFGLPIAIMVAGVGAAVVALAFGLGPLLPSTDEDGMEESASTGKSNPFFERIPIAGLAAGVVRDLVRSMSDRYGRSANR